MVQKMHRPRSKSLILGNVSLFVLVLTLLGCSGSSEPPVKYEDYEGLEERLPFAAIEPSKCLHQRTAQPS